MTSFGTLFRTARQDKGWSIDLVSFKSKIQARIIEKLENDDFSGFSSASYAKSFLRKYSELLELNLESEINQLEIVGYEKKDSYVSQESVRESLEMTLFSKKNDRYKKAEKSKGSPVFLVGSVVVLLSSLAGFYYLGSKANSPEIGARHILEEFESKPESFSRNREAKERLVSEKTPLQPLSTSLSESSPLASTRSLRPAQPYPRAGAGAGAGVIDPMNELNSNHSGFIEKPDLKNLSIPLIDPDPLNNRGPATIDPRSALDPSDSLFQ